MVCRLNRTWLHDFLCAGYPVIRYRVNSSNFLWRFREFSVVFNCVANTHRFISSNVLIKFEYFAL